MISMPIRPVSRVFRNLTTNATVSGSIPICSSTTSSNTIYRDHSTLIGCLLYPSGQNCSPLGLNSLTVQRIYHRVKKPLVQLSSFQSTKTGPHVVYFHNSPGFTRGRSSIFLTKALLFKRTNSWIQETPSTSSITQRRTYKIVGRPTLRCEGCFFSKRRGILRVICKENPRHKQRKRYPVSKYKADYRRIALKNMGAREKRKTFIRVL